MLTGKELGHAIKAAIEAKGVTQKAVAAFFGVKPPSVSDWIKRGTISKEKLPRLWGYFSDVVGPEHWGLRSWPTVALTTDSDMSTEDAIEFFHAHRTSNVFAADEIERVGLAPAQRLVAVVGQAKLGENGWYDVVQAAGSDGFVEAVSNDPEAYALRVVGDSMHPAIKSGWYVLVEPSHEPCPSDYVAVALTDGRKMVKEFLYRTDREVGLQSVNGAKRLTLQLDQIATIHPVSNLLSPGKYRPT